MGKDCLIRFAQGGNIDVQKRDIIRSMNYEQGAVIDVGRQLARDALAL